MAERTWARVQVQLQVGVQAAVEEAAVEEATVEEATVEEATVEEATVEEATVEEATVEEATPSLAVDQDAASAEVGQVEAGEVLMGAASEVPLRRARDVRQARPDRPGTCESVGAAQGGPGVVVSPTDVAPQVVGRSEVGHPAPNHVWGHAAAAIDQADPPANPPPTAILRSPDVPGPDGKIGLKGVIR